MGFCAGSGLALPENGEQTMKRGKAVLHTACLTLGLLMALGGSAWAQCQCALGGPAVSCPRLEFDGVLIGNAKLLTVVVTAPSAGPTTATASISGVNTIEFSIVSPPCPALGASATCGITVLFTPMGCEGRFADLTVTFTSAGAAPTTCQVVIPLRGIGCSFDCAINFTQLSTDLSSSTRSRILRELFLAQADLATRCFRLSCARCIDQAEVTRLITAGMPLNLVAPLLDQIDCLLLVNACAPAL
jgi:hypothetical protein